MINSIFRDVFLPILNVNSLIKQQEEKKKKKLLALVVKVVF